MTEPKPQPSEPSFAQIRAMISVLGDDRGALQESARRRLLHLGEQAVPMLREGAEVEHMGTRTRCRALLREIEVRELLHRFGRLRLGQMGRESAPGLLEGAMMAAQMVRTFVPESRKLAAQLRREANALRRDFEGRSLPMCAKLLAERLHGQFGLKGCDAEDVDVDHVLVDRALANGVGAPIALSLIYLLVARWAGLSAAGVALPNHVLIRIHGPRPLLLDPFHGGRVIPKADCARYLRATGFDRVREHLRDLTDREVLIHYLRSLRRASTRRQSDARATLGKALGLLETS
ncbi:MAG: regulator of sirC expression with transglutaminase-like and TPR domain [Planctomycetota bacterium]|jgi:regulator of sirC expression with transglutaminase-like and TPR domain